MKYFLILSCLLFFTACSPIDSVQPMDQQQTKLLVHSMYPEINAKAQR